MRAVEVIIRKRDGATLSPVEIREFIDGYVRDEIADYQAAAFLMAAFLRGLNFEETAALTRAMMESGDVYNLDHLGLGVTVDKHSTGGVGDKVSLVLAPLVAACGVTVPMVSGRGLGHTGGTLDKLESIPGFDVRLDESKFRKQLQTVHVAMIGQTENFVPADRKLYALRDVTGTVENVPLICASIMSKKIASGAHALVMDVKCGSGAFMTTLEKARDLAKGLIGVGQAMGRPVHALITDMNQPLGHAVGNSLEVQEAIACLHGRGPADLQEITLDLAAEMLLLGQKASSISCARNAALEALNSGAAWQRFREMVEAQSGAVDYIDAPEKLDVSTNMMEIVAEHSGCISEIDTRSIGNSAVILGAGRSKTSDPVDYGVGLILYKKIGAMVEAGEPLVRIYHRNGRGLDEVRKRVKEAIIVSESPASPRPIVLERLVEEVA